MKKTQGFLFVGFLAVFLLYGLGIAKAAAPYVTINKGAPSTNTRKVQLYLQGPDNVQYMKISHKPDFSGADWEMFHPQKTWYLDYGAGQKTIFVKFKDSSGNISSSAYTATIRLEVPATMVVDFSINNGVAETDSRYVQLVLKYSWGVDSYLISNDVDLGGIEFQEAPRAASTTLPWILSAGSGDKTVWAQFKDAAGQLKTVSKKIHYEQPPAYIAEGGLIKGQTATVYYYGYDGLIHPFINNLVYQSWYTDFSNINSVSNSKLRQYQFGDPMCIKPGTWLVKFYSFPKVYVVEPGCQLLPLRSEAEAFLLYGSGWAKRIVELDPVHQSYYTVLTYDASDPEKKIVDKDRDGVIENTEKEYNSSDAKEDTDRDGLSDFEEIYFWFTDPTDSDTDNDGHNDGAEILRGYSPTSKDRINTIAENTYEYPRGSVIKRKADGKLYYHHSDGNYYYAGKNAQDKLIASNRLQEKFILDSPFEIKFSPAGKNRGIADKDPDIYCPLKILNNRIQKL